MTSKQRAYLKGLAMNIEPVFQIGQVRTYSLRPPKPYVKVLTGKSL